MCLIAFAWDYHPEFKLILAANRDEFYDRPTSKVGYWHDQPNILGGRDLKASGTWLALNKQGRFGALTNYRDIQHIKPSAPSRGDIIPGFLLANKQPEEYARDLGAAAVKFNGFNLLVSDFQSMIHYSNYEHKINQVTPGIHGLSNALLNTDWPKVNALKAAFSETISTNFKQEDLFSILESKATYSRHELPQTGLTPEMEEALSAVCIRTEKYGTCSSTVLTVSRTGSVNFAERTHPVGNKSPETVNFEFKIKQ